MYKRNLKEERNGISKVEADLGNSKLPYQKGRRRGRRAKEKSAEVKEDTQTTFDELKTDKFIKDKSCNNSVKVCKDIDSEFEGASFRTHENGEFLNSNASSVNGTFEKMCESIPFEPQSSKNKNIRVSKIYDSMKHEKNLNVEIEMEYINSKNESADDLCLKESNEVSLIDDCLSLAASVGYLKFDTIEIGDTDEPEENLNAQIEIESISTKNESADDLCLEQSEVSLSDDCFSQAVSLGYLKFDSIEIGDTDEPEENLNAQIEMESINKNTSADDLCLKEFNEVSLIDDCLSQAASVGYLKFDCIEIDERQVPSSLCCYYC